MLSNKAGTNCVEVRPHDDQYIYCLPVPARMLSIE
jgi:hypothetical protein